MSVEVAQYSSPPRTLVTDLYHPLHEEMEAAIAGPSRTPHWTDATRILSVPNAEAAITGPSRTPHWTDATRILSVPNAEAAITGPTHTPHWTGGTRFLSVPNTSRFRIEDDMPPPLYPRGTCGVCDDDVSGPQAFRIPDCNHIFCKDCLKRWTRTRLEERRYPVPCPECMMEDRTSKIYVPDDDFARLELPDKEWNIFQELQLAQHAMPLHCPKCKVDMQVDRDDYMLYKDVTCPMTGCGHRWCTDCRKAIGATELKHHCKNKKLDRLVRRKGWRYCPGCRIPIQKASGCNHMICGAPGCSVHFCYACAGLIYDPSSPDTTEMTMTMSIITHYTHCRQFSRAVTIRQGARRIGRGTARFLFRLLGFR